MNESDSSKESPLTIRRLMIWTFGVAAALTVIKLIDQSSARAWNLVVPYNPQPAGLQTSDYIGAFVYGTCLSLFLIAACNKHFWRSPGKILCMIFSLICILDWGLTLIANALVIQYVTVIELPPLPGESQIQLGSQSSASFIESGFIFGMFFQEFAGKIGYCLGVPILLFTLFRSREESKLWKLVWLGFLCFTILMLLEFYGLRERLFSFPPGLARFYFPTAIGIPIVTMMIVLTSDWIRKIKIDWWTLVASSLLTAAWVAMVVLQLLS